MQKSAFILAVGLFNLAVFILTTLFLPPARSFSYNNPVSYYINSRTDWHIAFGIAVATALISWGAYLVVVSYQQQKTDN